MGIFVKEESNSQTTNKAKRSEEGEKGEGE